MTTITVERELLEQALTALTYQGTMGPTRRQRRAATVAALRVALAEPATAPEFPADWAQMLHYPECWDTAAYPELRDAIHEALAWSGCSVCKPATALALAEQERDTLAELNHAQWLALENVRLLAARHRREEWAQHMLRFCDEAGVAARTLRAAYSDGKLFAQSNPSTASRRTSHDQPSV
jgi:hypothetical protein